MHLRVLNRAAKRFGQRALSGARRVGSVLDKGIGQIAGVAGHLDPNLVGDLVGPHAKEAVQHSRKALASYEDLRQHVTGGPR